jgi:hypothetical protein
MMKKIMEMISYGRYSAKVLGLYIGVMYRPDCSGKDIYSYYFDDTRIKENNYVKKLGGIK